MIVEVLKGGNAGAVGEVIEKASGQYDVKLQNGKVIYLGIDDIKEVK